MRLNFLSVAGFLTADMILLLCVIVIGAAVQIGVGIGFSIFVAPVMMVLFGTSTAVPVLLLLNTLVSAAGTDRGLWRQDRAAISNAIIGCLVGIALGLVVYPYLSEPVVLVITAALLFIGVLVSMLSAGQGMGRTMSNGVSGLSGLATVWAATPGPLMVLGFLAGGRDPQSARKLVQPVALAAYGAAFVLHAVSDWSIVANAPWLVPCALAALLGSVLGRWIGPLLPQRAIAASIRIISIAACAVLLRRAYIIGG
ncbi:TSUP family transporter [Gammaproteobacteria bacterium]|nr:TSUP family transporter [Gammaproteobacteria bacterium]